ncbi:MAG: HEPN domain-containing protein [Clostridium sp.]|nr:HEPN domain-containing protein [Clostridium sp.]
MSKLLNRAKVNRKIVADNYALINTDDAYLDSCCYNIQQAIELTLKFLVEMNGDVYVENHDIRAQLNKLSKLPVKLPRENELRNMAVTLNSWEAESRYLDSFTAVIADLDAAIEIADALIAFADNSVKQASLSKMEIFPDA